MINNSIHIEELKSEILDRNLITITTDVSGIIIDVSKGFEALFGYAKDELIGFTHQIINHDRSANGNLQSIQVQSTPSPNGGAIVSQ